MLFPTASEQLSKRRWTRARGDSKVDVGWGLCGLCEQGPSLVVHKQEELVG